ncbi:MAG: hypothetical protein WBO55_11820 [Rhizobiaceae bacterium]
MATIIAIEAWLAKGWRPGRMREPADFPGAEVLMFTGVRYSRDPDRQAGQGEISAPRQSPRKRRARNSEAAG